MAKLKAWEIGVLVLILIVVFVVSLLLQPGEDALQPKVEVPEGASDNYAAELAEIYVDPLACEAIEDESARADCLGEVEDKQFLEAGSEAVQEVTAGVQSSDKKLYSQAMIKRDASYCEQMMDREMRQKCLNALK